jgi:hypothetical protein
VATLPYVTAPGNIDKALVAIKSAQTPERVTQDFVKTVLKIKGGSGDQIASYLKKIGFVNSDGTPSPIYSRFRNVSTSGAAAMDALRHGYAPLYRRNEFMHKLDDSELKGLVIEETGDSHDSSVPNLVLSAINALRKHAKETHAKAGESDSSEQQRKNAAEVLRVPSDDLRSGLNLSYTINLNLPATTDIAVFNAIFKSLKEHLLRSANEQ